MENMKRICTRTLDELGRIVVPSEIRAKLGLEEGDTFAMYYVDGNTFMLQLAEKSPQKKCLLCGTNEVTETIKGKNICGQCYDEIKND